MSTLTEMREALEQLEQDARRFRWLCANMSVAYNLLAHASQMAEEIRADQLRISIDAQILPETPGPTEPAGAQT